MASTYKKRAIPEATRRGSRQPHDPLTEDVVSDSRPPHSRKGREGKGTGKGYLQDQVSRLTTAHAFGDWTWS